MVPGSNPGGPTNKAPLETQNGGSPQAGKPDKWSQENEARSPNSILSRETSSAGAGSFTDPLLQAASALLGLLLAALGSHKTGMLSLKELAEVAKRLHETLFGEKPSSEPAIVWNEEVRQDYIKWMRANGRSEKYISTCLYYLDKYMSGREVREPDDIVDIFSKCKRGVNNLSLIHI